MKLAKLLNLIDDEETIKKTIALDRETQTNYLNRQYKKALKSLRSLNEIDETEFFITKGDYKDEDEGGLDLNLYLDCRKEGDDANYSLTTIEWEDVVNFEIDDELVLTEGANNVVATILSEITVRGYSRKEVSKGIKKLFKKIDNGAKNTEFIPLRDLLDKIEKK